jgi:uncharacterized membrane protein YcgQ (UPF0703/DUF1980 family)
MAKGSVVNLPKDQWVQVTGTNDQTRYDGEVIPMIKIEQISKIAAPSNLMLLM